MQYVLAPAEDCVLSPRGTDAGLFWRVGRLFLTLFVEALLISAQAQHVAFRGAHGFAGLLYDLGPWKIRLPITLTVVFLLFWQAKGRQNIQRILARPIGRGIAWHWLWTHIGAISLFAWLSLSLLNHPPQGVLLNSLLVVCLAMGVGAVVSGALAFLPARVWRDIFRGTGDVWDLSVLYRPLGNATLGALFQTFPTKVV